jgi:hypothetical protein
MAAIPEALQAMQAAEPRTRTLQPTIRIAVAVEVEMAALEAREASVGIVLASSAALAVRRSRFRRVRFLWAAALVQERQTTVPTGFPARIPATTIAEQTVPASIAAARQEAASSSFTRETSLVLEPSVPTGSRPSRRKTMVVAAVAQAARF